MILIWLVLVPRIQVCAAAAENPTKSICGVLLLPGDGGEIAMHVENGAAHAIRLYVRSEEKADGALQILFEQGGTRSVIFTGKAQALFQGEMLLGTLEPGKGAEIIAELSESKEELALTVFSVPVNSGERRPLRAVFFLCLWIGLALFGVYLHLARRKRRKST